MFTWGAEEFDASTIGVVSFEEEEWVEEDYVYYIYVSGHADDYYNGAYLRDEDWSGFAHFAKADRSAHLYYLDSGSGYWQLDYREQDGTADYYDGGYSSAQPHLDHLSGDVEWSGSSGSIYMEQGFEEYVPAEGESAAVPEGQVYIRISNHVQDYYNGDYWYVESWNGYPHFATEDRSAHLFYLGTGGGYW